MRAPTITCSPRFVAYGTAIPAGNAAPEPALAFIRFISDPARRERWKAAGFELVGKPWTEPPPSGSR